MAKFTYTEPKSTGAEGRNLGRHGFVRTGSEIELNPEESAEALRDPRFKLVVPTVPETAKTDAAKPDPAKPETAKPDAGKPK